MVRHPPQKLLHQLVALVLTHLLFLEHLDFPALSFVAVMQGSISTWRWVLEPLIQPPWHSPLPPLHPQQGLGKLRQHKCHAFQTPEQEMDVFNTILVWLAALRHLILLQPLQRIWRAKSNTFLQLILLLNIFHLFPFFRYNICIRPEKGYCCVQYSLCADANSWSIDSSIATASVDTQCAKDYVGIDGVQGSCNLGYHNLLSSRLCGQKFSTYSTMTPDANSVCGEFFSWYQYSCLSYVDEFPFQTALLLLPLKFTQMIPQMALMRFKEDSV